ncbi:MAG: hypothetical protein MUF33_02075 [Candidatus Nanopelagicales bacterium]|jgi:hypothetical protein|nr:hypothetical protein [Candidatus Nanopelagicales bacterium]
MPRRSGTVIGYYTDTVEVDVDVDITAEMVHEWAMDHPDKAAKAIAGRPVRIDPMYRVLQDWHNTEHPMAFRVCDHPVCKAAHSE